MHTVDTWPAGLTKISRPLFSFTVTLDVVERRSSHGASPALPSLLFSNSQYRPWVNCRATYQEKDIDIGFCVVHSHHEDCTVRAVGSVLCPRPFWVNKLYRQLGLLPREVRRVSSGPLEKVWR
jgi:hypothetical protein